jgi:hypothetical protein
MFRRTSINVKGTTGLAIAAVIMIAVLIGFPAYRVFLAISLAIGIVVALISICEIAIARSATRTSITNVRWAWTDRLRLATSARNPETELCAFSPDS